MNLVQNNIYHVYNRGNNKQKIFFSRDNYLYFLKTMHKTIAPCCDVLAWCLMPNHFHFLIHANEKSIIEIKDGSFPRQQFSQQVKQLLSSYAKAVNKQYNFTGSLFQQKTKAICVNDGKLSYAVTAFHYIHQNPLKASLVKNMEAWEFSSFIDYVGMRKDDLCNKELACLLLDLNIETLYEESYKAILENAIKLIM
jgi:putative transposase